MKNIQTTYLILILTIIISYSTSAESLDDSVSVTKTCRQLKITNNSYQTIYIFAIEEKSASLIEWSPSFDSPKIEKNRSLEIGYWEIVKKKRKLQKGDKIIIFYWDDTYKTTSKVYHKIIAI